MARSKKNPRPGRRPRAAHETMTRRDLAQKMAERLGRRHTAVEMLECVQAAIDCMAEAMLEGRHIEFRDFGVFEIVERKARLWHEKQQRKQQARAEPLKKAHQLSWIR